MRYVLNFLIGIAATAGYVNLGHAQTSSGELKLDPAGQTVKLNPQPIPPGGKVKLNPQPIPPGDKVKLNPQPIPPGDKVQLNPQPIPPGDKVQLNPQPIPPKLPHAGPATPVIR